MINMVYEFTQAQQDALQEIGNIGIGNAATALSKMIDRKVNIDIPESRIVPLEQVCPMIGCQEMVHGVYVRILGDLKGDTLLLFPEASASRLVERMMSLPSGSLKELGEEGISAFLEFANIVVGAYLNSIADFLSLKLLPDVPLAANDVAQAVLDSVLSSIGQNADDLLFIKTRFNIEGVDVEGLMLMLFDQASMNQVLRMLEEKFSLTI